MSAEEMFKMNGKVMTEGYSMGRILKRTLKSIRTQPSPGMLMASFFTQLGMKKTYAQIYSRKP
jgi:hypothetical protein